MQVASRLLVSPEAMQLEPPAFDAVASAAVEMHEVVKAVAARYNKAAGYRTPFQVNAVHYLQYLQCLRWAVAWAPGRAQYAVSAGGQV